MPGHLVASERLSQREKAEVDLVTCEPGALLGYLPVGTRISLH